MLESMDPVLRNTLFVFAAAVLMFLGGVINSVVISRSSLPKMAREAFDMADDALSKLNDYKEKATKEREEERKEREAEAATYKQQIEDLRAMINGELKITGFASAKKLMEHGYADIEGGRIEFVRKNAPASVFQDSA